MSNKHSLRLFCLALLFNLTSQTTQAADSAYHFDSQWPALPQTWAFEDIHSIAAAPDGSVWISNAINPRSARIGSYPLQHIAADGRILNQFGLQDKSYDPNAENTGIGKAELSIANDGTVWLATPYGKVLHISTTGNILLSFNFDFNREQSSASPAISIAPDGSLWLISINTLLHFNAEGTLLATLNGNCDSCNGTNKPKQLWYPEDLAIANDGSIWVADTGNDRLQHFSAKGDYIGSIATGIESHPHSLTIAKDGTLWSSLTKVEVKIDANGGITPISDFEYILKQYSTTGNLLKTLGGSGTGPGKLQNPNSKTAPKISQANDASLWVSDNGNRRLQHLSADGSFISQVGRAFSDAKVENAFDFPLDIARLSDNSIWISTKDYPYTLSHFGATAGFIEQFINPAGTSFQDKISIPHANDGSMWQADPDYFRLQRKLQDGSIGGQIGGTQGMGPGQFASITQVITTPEGGVWVEDKQNDLYRNPTLFRLQYFNATGQLTSKQSYQKSLYPSEESDYRKGNNRWVVDPDNSLWLIDYDGHYLQHISPNGDLLDRIGGIVGTEPGTFNSISAIMRSSDGALWLVDQGNNRLQKFVPNSNNNETASAAYNNDKQQLILNDVTIGKGQVHYAAVLQLKNERFTLIDAHETTARLAHPSNYDPLSATLSVPEANVSGISYQGEFKNTGNFSFKINSVAPLFKSPLNF